MRLIKKLLQLTATAVLLLVLLTLLCHIGYVTSRYVIVPLAPALAPDTASKLVALVTPASSITYSFFGVFKLTNYISGFFASFVLMVMLYWLNRLSNFIFEGGFNDIYRIANDKH